MNNKRINNKPNKIISLLLSFIVISFFFFRFMSSINILFTQGIFTYLSFFLSMLGFIISFFIDRTFRIGEYIFYSLFISFLLISFFFNRNVEFTHIIFYFQYFFISRIIIFSKLNRYFFLFYLLFILGYFYYHIFIGTLAFNAVAVNSQNSISLNILTALTLYLFASLSVNKFPSFILLFLASLVIIWTGSRSAILSFAVLAGLSFIYVIYRNKFFLLRTLIIFFVFLIIIGIFDIPAVSSVVFNINTFINNMILLISRKVDNNLFDDIRFTVINDYFGSLSSIRNLFFGTNFSSIQSINQLSNNPHNMFINLHARFGLLGFSIVFIFIVKSLRFFILRKNYLLFIYLVVILARGFSDSVGFWGIFDPLIFAFFFKFNSYRNDSYA